MAKKITTFIILLFGVVSISVAQIKLTSWNIQHMGKSKSDETISYMANLLKDFDVVAIQEVVAGNGGAQAVARLADELNRKGAKWEYTISDPTQSSPYSSERYAFLWKPSKVKIVDKAWLDQNYVQEIEREPYMIRLKYKDEIITIANFHAVPTAKQPETEVKYFKTFPELYPDECLIFLGDFNLPETHNVFNPLRSFGFTTAHTNQKASLRTKCDTQKPNDCLSKVYDHIIFKSNEINLLDSGVLHFYQDFPTIQLARKISDHIPIWVEFDISN